MSFKGQKIVLVTDELKALDRVVLCVSEMLGTAILVFLGCVSCVTLSPNNPIHLNISLSFGLAVMLSVQIFGHVSGSHINPIVTIAAVIMGNLALIEFPIYLVGQFIGAFLGYGLVMGITPSKYQKGDFLRMSNGTPHIEKVGVCSPALNMQLHPGQGFLVEFLLSLMLVLICCGVWDHRNSTKHDSVAIKFGLAVGVLALAGGTYTGANMNPARSFAPAAWHGDWQDHWVYWAGPILSAIVGAGFYRLVFTTPKPQVVMHTLEAPPLHPRK